MIKNIDKKQLVLLVFVVGLSIVILISMIFLKGQKSPPVGTPTISSDLEVTGIIPTKGTVLTPNQPQEISVTANQPVDLSELTIKLLSKNLINDVQIEEQFKPSLSSDNRTIKIKILDSIKPYSQYSLNILSNQKKILEISYLTDKPIPAPVSTNNQGLRQFLPFETETFKLSFDKKRNVYIFNFKYNPNSSDNLDTQYQKAKTKAEIFIKSKGIDLNSIAIEWRFS